MTDPYPITTGELVTVLLKEIGKEVPVLKSVLGVEASVFATLEKKRLEAILYSLLKRVGNIEDLLRHPKSAATLLYGCDQARHDILYEAKTETASI